MIKPELYHKTVGILFDAYFNDTLVHNDCFACAVGNMVAVGCNYELKRIGDRGYLQWPGRHYPASYGWGQVFISDGFGSQIVKPENYYGEAKHQIDSTGYRWEDLARIERAFENAPEGRCAEDYMFNGLVAVLEVLKEIHQVTDEDLLTANNKRFKDHYEHRQMAKV